LAGGVDNHEVVGADGGEDLAGVGYAGEAGVVDLEADGALGLESAELGEGAADPVVGVGAGAVEGGVVVDFAAGFEEAAAAETPGGAQDFVDEAVFEIAVGGEPLVEFGEGFVVLVLLVFADEVVGGEEAGFEGIAGGDGFAFGSVGAGGAGVSCFD
jgi:hypothetical protein